MALTTTANLANIGSFAVDVFSLGFLTINKHENIRDPLAEANTLLDGAMDRIANFSVYLNDKEFQTSMEECDKARALVRDAYQDRSSFENFIVRAKKYSQNKNQAHAAKLRCQEVADWVQRTSLKAKRRVDTNQRIIDQHKMKQRLERLANAGFKLPDSGNDLAMTEVQTDSVPEIAQPSSLAPLRTGNELRSPFRDPQENPWKTATVSGISLQSFASK